MFKINCKLLISCCNQNSGLYLLEFEPRKNRLNKVLEANCRGIVRYKEKYILTTIDKGILILDADLNIIKQKEITDILDLHGIALYNDRAYIVETKRNAIGIYDLISLERIDEINFSTENNDIYHINDLFIIEDKIYVSMFSFTRHWRELPDNASGAGIILEYSLEKKEIIKPVLENLTHPHSILVYDGQLFYCNSAKYEVKRNNEVIFNTDDYSRGLAIHNEFIFVGQSDNRKSSGQGCGLYIFNVITDKVEFIKLPSQEVYGILSIKL